MVLKSLKFKSGPLGKQLKSLKFNSGPLGKQLKSLKFNSGPLGQKLKSLKFGGLPLGEISPLKYLGEVTESGSPEETSSKRKHILAALVALIIVGLIIKNRRS